MAYKCVGGFLDGMQVYTREDANQCVQGGGQVQGDGGGAGICGGRRGSFPIDLMRILL
jgi:hypothetical protein